METWFKHRWTVLLIIILLGGFFRFYLLSDIPPGLYPDEAMNGLDALHAVESGDFQVFYSDNNGREGLYMNLVALMIQIFGVSAWVIRATSAAAGTLSLLAMAFFAYEFGLAFFSDRNKKDRDRLAVLLMLAATLLLALSVWHVHFSRIGFRAVLLPLFSAAGFGFLLRGFRLGRRIDFALSGSMFALSFSTYIASRILPVVFALPFLFSGFVRQDGRLRFVGGSEWVRRIGIFSAALLLVALPLIGYFAANPADFTGRAGDVSVFSAENPLTALLISSGKTLAMFHLFGDFNWRHGVAGRPVLDPLTGALLLIGFALIVRRLVSSRMAWLVFVWFGAMLLPAAATAEGLPHALRAYGATVPALLLASLGAVWLWDRYRQTIPQVLRAGTLSFLAVLILLFNFHQYFFAWAGSTELDGAFRGDLTRISEYLNERTALHDQELQQAEDEARIEELSGAIDYVIVNEPYNVPLRGIPMPVATIRYLTSDHPGIAYLTGDDVSAITPIFGRTIIVTTEPPDQDLEASIQAAFPAAAREDRNGYTVYRLE